MRDALAVFARVPGAEPVKTRLAAALGAERAAALARAFLLDTLNRVSAVPAERFLWYTPPEARDALAHLLEKALPGESIPERGAPSPSLPVLASRAPQPFTLTLLPQVPGPLGTRLEAALRTHLGHGCRRVCVIGSDSPTLPLERITGALSALDDADFVLVPTSDGGFALLAARVCPAGLLDGIAWSSPRTFAETRDRLAAFGPVAILDPWYDIDAPDDLRRLADDPALAQCPATRAAMREACQLWAGNTPAGGGV